MQKGDAVMVLEDRTGKVSQCLFLNPGVLGSLISTDVSDPFRGRPPVLWLLMDEKAVKAFPEYNTVQDIWEIRIAKSNEVFKFKGLYPDLMRVRQGKED